jgi:CheY-like chemotaxis protein
LSGRRVLVVDDHSINRRLLRLQLESYGLRVDDAADALGGWALLEKAAAAQDPYAVAILDHMMPDIDGLELARRIRADARFAGLRLLLNSSAGVGDLADARNLGFDAVEEKPVLPRALIGAICGLIGDEPIATAGAADTSPGNAPAKTDDVRILLVGDDRTGQHLVLEMLSRSHYRVDTVADGQEAVRAVAKLPYDLILMDLWMPAIDGVEAVRRIRALGGGASRIPIIALTANAQDEDVAEYATAGMQDVVEKPVDRDVLLAAIDAALDAAEGPGVGPGVAPIFQAAAE